MKTNTYEIFIVLTHEYAKIFYPQFFFSSFGTQPEIRKLNLQVSSHLFFFLCFSIAHNV